MSHTKQNPLAYDSGDGELIAEDKDGGTLTVAENLVNDKTGYRIAECWNALASVRNPEAVKELIEEAKKSARWIPHTGYGPEHAHIDCRRCEMDAALAALDQEKPKEGDHAV